MEISFFVSCLWMIAITMLQNCQLDGNKRRSSAFHQIGTLARATSCIDICIHISDSDDGCIRLQRTRTRAYTSTRSRFALLYREEILLNEIKTGRIRNRSRASKCVCGKCLLSAFLIVVCRESLQKNNDQTYARCKMWNVSTNIFPANYLIFYIFVHDRYDKTK